MKKNINLLTPEELTKALQEDTCKRFLPRYGGKRFIISLYYHLDRLMIIEKENAELRK